METITEEEAIVLVKKKIEKEANRYIHKWPEENLSVQNGRWGPFIKIEKDRKSYKLLNKKGEKMTPEEAKEVTLEYVIELVKDQGGVLKKKKAPKKKPAAKKKTAAKKTTKKKPAAKKKTTKK